MLKIWCLLVTFWKCPTWLVVSTRWAAFPKKVWTPVAMTTASISPCLQVEPEYTPSPGPFETGRDSPVRADWRNAQQRGNNGVTEPFGIYDRYNNKLMILKENEEGKNSPHTWSIFKGSPSSRRASAGIISPSLMLIMSPGTRTEASCSFHLPSRRTFPTTDKKEWNYEGEHK